MPRRAQLPIFILLFLMPNLLIILYTPLINKLLLMYYFLFTMIKISPFLSHGTLALVIVIVVIITPCSAPGLEFFSIIPDTTWNIILLTTLLTFSTSSCSTSSSFYALSPSSLLFQFFLVKLYFYTVSHLLIFLFF